MKKRILLLCAMMIIAPLSLSACKTTQKENSHTTEEDVIDGELVLANETVKITLGEEFTAKAMVGEETVECTWNSANSEIAEVKGNGTVVGKNVGSTVITATYKNQTASCTVEIGLNGNLPVFQLNAVDNNSVQIDTLHSVNLEGNVLFNGKIYSDVEYEFSVSDDTVGKIENGEFIPLTTGECVVTATAKWRGVESPLLTKTVNVKVVSSCYVLINDELQFDDIELYTVAELNGKNYKKESPFNAKAYVDGVAYEPTITLSSTDVVEYNEAEKKLTAKKKGETQVTLSYSNGTVNIEENYTVKVFAPVEKYGKTIVDFSAMDGEMFDVDGKNVLTELFGTDNPLNSAVQNETELDVSTGKILGVETSSEGITKTTVTVYGEKYGYTFNVEGYTMVLDEAKDLVTAFRFTNNAETEVTSGYYVLKNDIDMSLFDTNGDGKTGYNQYPDAINPSSSWTNVSMKKFNGTLDGNGHSVNGMHIGLSEGLFGIIDGGTVKNIGFTNLQTHGWQTYLFGRQIKNATVENVYISIDLNLTQGTNSDKVEFFGLFGDDAFQTTTYKDIIIEMNECFTSLAKNPLWGLGLFRKTPLANGGEPNFENVYFVVPKSADGRVLPMYQNTAETVYAVNDFAEIPDGTRVTFDETTKNPVENKSGTNTVTHYKGVKRFDNYSLMKAEVQKVGNWNISSGTPVWTTEE